MLLEIVSAMPCSPCFSLIFGSIFCFFFSGGRKSRGPSLLALLETGESEVGDFSPPFRSSRGVERRLKSGAERLGGVDY